MWRDVDLMRLFSYDETVTAGRVDAFVKGMFFDDLKAILQEAGTPWPRRYVGFKDYTEAEFNAVATAAARAAFPHLPPRQALHRLGLLAFPTLKTSLIGKVVFGVLGNDVAATFRAAGKGFEISTSACKVELLELLSNRCVLDIRGVSLPIEGYQLGVFEGAIVACQHTPDRARVQLETEYAGQLEVSWR